MKNSADLGGCYPPSTSAFGPLDLRNSSYPTKPQSIVAKYTLHLSLFSQRKKGTGDPIILQTLDLL